MSGYVLYILYILFSRFSVLFIVFFFKQKTAYEMRISDWSSDVCSSDLAPRRGPPARLRRCLPHARDNGGAGERRGVASRSRERRHAASAVVRAHISTTRIELPDDVPGDTIAASDWKLRPEHPHWPLVWLTVLPQLAAGVSATPTIGRAHVRTPITNAHLE